MNTNGLAKHYATLTRWERLPLIVAAQERGDWQEVRRLADAAPCHDWRVPDYCGLAEGLPLVTLLHLLRQLATALRLLAVAGVALADGPSKGKKADTAQRQEPAADALLRLLAYRLTAQADGWKQFCAELRIDPETRLRFLPGAGEVQSYMEAFGAYAYTHAEDLDYLRRNREAAGGADGLDTAVDVARELRTALERFNAKWDGRSDSPDPMQELRDAWEHLVAGKAKNPRPLASG